MGIEYIKEVKKQKNLTNEELSKLSGVPIGTLNKILSGHTPDPQFETVKAICRALGISLAALDDFETDTKIQTIAAHFDGDEYTEEQLDRIKAFAAFIKSENNK